MSVNSTVAISRNEALVMILGALTRASDAELEDMLLTLVGGEGRCYHNFSIVSSERYFELVHNSRVCDTCHGVQDW